MKTRTIVLTFLMGLCFFVRSQDRFAILEQKLIELSKSAPGLNEKVDLSINGASIPEFIRAIGVSNNLNVNVDPTIEGNIINNFSKVTAQEVFLFLCRNYNLDINFIGPILSFVKYTAPIAPARLTAKKINIAYEPTAQLLSFELQNDTLSSTAKEITKQTGKNIIFSPELMGKLVSGFVQNSSITSALEKLAFANDMKVSLTSDNFYVFERKIQEAATKAGISTIGTNTSNFGLTNTNNSNMSVKDGLISVNAQNVAISDLVNAVSKELNKEYFLFNELKGSTTLKVNDASYDDFLKLLFNGTDFTFKKEGTIYLLGDRNLEGLRQSKLITLKNRTIERVLDFIPAELKKGVDIKTFSDLNGLIVSGSQPRINELEAFIRQIDLVVPLVHIEVIIADVRKSNTISTGISAGIGAKPAGATTGTIAPQIDLSLNAASINNLVSGINGLGIINLGSVTPNFYLTLHALEEQGALKIRSTPQIATLNGHEAKLKIGSTVYYLEVQNTLLNNVGNTNISQSQQYKSLDADLAITINPQVSGDEQITMSIGVTQASFTERLSPTAPPGKLNRDFQSLVRVKNGEMIMLGGLEENSINNTGSGLPLISRIPILKWIFGTRTRSKSDNKLTIFIKPTIIYS